MLPTDAVVKSNPDADPLRSGQIILEQVWTGGENSHVSVHVYVVYVPEPWKLRSHNMLAASPSSTASKSRKAARSRASTQSSPPEAWSKSLA
jgi:hypothetical protein